MQWLDDNEEDLFDVIRVRDIVPSDGRDILQLKPGENCKASFASKLYDCRILAVGTAQTDIWPIIPPVLTGIGGS